MVLSHEDWQSLGDRSFGLFYILPWREEKGWPHEGLVSYMWLQWWMWSAVDVRILIVNQPQSSEVTEKKNQPLT